MLFKTGKEQFFKNVLIPWLRNEWSAHLSTQRKEHKLANEIDTASAVWRLRHDFQYKACLGFIARLCQEKKQNKGRGKEERKGERGNGEGT